MTRTGRRPRPRLAALGLVAMLVSAIALGVTGGLAMTHQVGSPAELSPAVVSADPSDAHASFEDPCPGCADHPEAFAMVCVMIALAAVGLASARLTRLSWRALMPRRTITARIVILSPARAPSLDALGISRT